ncbi:MAG: hypothetical protein OHK0026_17370 [Rhodocyclaceae bacterium]
MTSIRQNPPTPDFRSPGTLARAVLAANLIALLAAAARAPGWAATPDALAELAALVEPALTLVVALLFLLQPWLHRLAWAALVPLVVAIAAAAAWTLSALLEPSRRELLLPSGAGVAAAWSALAAALVLYYLYLRGKALSPALSEARLAALGARIRPHFFFNSLNAVLGILREDPRRAETALEELAEMFRAVMGDGRDLITLGEEIALCRKYLDLERLRLGARLQVEWRLEDVPEDAAVPPLLLQPLIENAVYHGVEPAEAPAVVTIAIRRQMDSVVIELSNPFHGSNSHRIGNRMALANVRERLALFFDLEAQLETWLAGANYHLRIRIPYRRAAR